MISKHSHFEDNVMKVFNLGYIGDWVIAVAKKKVPCLFRFGFPDVAVTYSCPG